MRDAEMTIAEMEKNILDKEINGKRSFGWQERLGKYNCYRLIITLLLSVLTVNLSAQKYDHLEKLVKETEEIQIPEASSDGKWIAWYSLLGDGSKNLKIQNVLNQDRLLERKNINFRMFIKNNIAIQSKETLEYVNLETGKSINLKDVNRFLYDQINDVVVILYTAKAGSKLEVFDTNLKLKQTVADVQYLYSKDEVIVVRKKIGELNEVLVWNKTAFETVFSTTDELRNVAPAGLEKKGFVAHTNKALKSLIYYISPEKKQYVLDVSQYSDYDQMTLSPSLSDHQIVVKLTKKERAKTEMVNLWYGTDFDLAANNAFVMKSIQIDWDPFSGKEILMNRPGYFGATAIGNSLYLMNQVDKNQVDKMDKAGGDGFDRMFLWNAISDKYTHVSDLNREMVISPDAKYLLIQQDNNWQLYNTLTLVSEELNVSSELIPYFTSDKDVLWVGGNLIAQQNVINKKIDQIFKGDNSIIELLDFKRQNQEVGVKRDFRSTDRSKNLLVRITDVRNQNTSYAFLKHNKLHTIQSWTPDQITAFNKLGQEDNYYWITENYNKRPTLMVKIGKANPIKLHVSDPNNQKFEKTELIKISYKGSDGETISGALYMPLNYDRSKKYPVVIHIYEKQDYLTKNFLTPSLSNQTGYNIPLLMEEGFAVLLADISQSDKGAGISALESIDNALDELQKVKNVDMDRIGLMGHSFGGYQTNFIAGQSKRFAAYVSGASVSDVVRTYYAYNYNFNAPDYYRYERRQYWFKSTVAENPDKYIKNNPIMYAQNVSAPMLLWTGTDDGNVSPEGTKSLFIALRKYRKPVISLFYNKERHTVVKPEAQKDLTFKILDWFNYHLKGSKNIPWIDKQMNLDK